MGTHLRFLVTRNGASSGKPSLLGPLKCLHFDGVLRIASGWGTLQCRGRLVRIVLVEWSHWEVGNLFNGWRRTQGAGKAFQQRVSIHLMPLQKYKNKKQQQQQQQQQQRNKTRVPKKAPHGSGSEGPPLAASCGFVGSITGRERRLHLAVAFAEAFYRREGRANVSGQMASWFLSWRYRCSLLGSGMSRDMCSCCQLWRRGEGGGGTQENIG